MSFWKKVTISTQAQERKSAKTCGIKIYLDIESSEPRRTTQCRNYININIDNAMSFFEKR